MTDPITLQPYREEDSPALAALFYETVHRVNIKDYTPAQVQAWAPAPPDPDASPAAEIYLSADDRL